MAAISNQKNTSKPTSSTDDDRNGTNEPEEPAQPQNVPHVTGKPRMSPQQHQGGKKKYSLITTRRRNRYGMDPKRNLFPKTKKHRYFPITCVYCGKLFQPPELKVHQRKVHFKEPEELPKSEKSVPKATEGPRKTKSPGGFPRNLKVCYICGQIFGSKSLGIHEPKCLEKWRLQNERLPKRMRAQEPVKPEPLPEVKGAKDGEYYLPDYDANAEAALKSHLKTLIPCGHCGRTFSPDRILQHQSCCIERPRRK